MGVKLHIDPTLCIARASAYAIHAWSAEKFLLEHRIKPLRSTRKIVCVEHAAVVTNQLFSKSALSKADSVNQVSMRANGFVFLDEVTDHHPIWSDKRRMLILNDRLTYLHLKRNP